MLLQLLACAADDVGSSNGKALPLGECSWPANLASLGSSAREVCSATRAYLSCSTQGGGGLWCPSNDSSSCADPTLADQHVKDCESRCKADEYVAICGGVGPGAVPEPPSGCRFDTANPGGSVTYCCPCE